MGIRCFLLEPTPKVNRYLRRYVDLPCSGPMSFHNAKVYWDTVESTVEMNKPVDDTVLRDNPLWPTHCECGYEFKSTDEWQVFTDRLWQRVDTGEEYTMRDAPVGAMWNAYWFAEHAAWRGPDGKTMVVKCPPDGHEWVIDGRASNCTMPDDIVHRCWVRHGEPP